MSTLCAICESATATRQCQQCASAMCGECDVEMHQPKKMAAHQRSEISSLSQSKTLCELCEDAIAEVHCKECGMSLCRANQCDTEQHRPKSKQGHVRTALGEPTPAPPVTASAAQPTVPLVSKPVLRSSNEQSKLTLLAPAASSLCSLCDSEPGAVTCKECDESFCESCDADLHTPAKMKAHQRTRLAQRPPAQSLQPSHWQSQPQPPATPRTPYGDSESSADSRPMTALVTPTKPVTNEAAETRAEAVPKPVVPPVVISPVTAAISVNPVFAVASPRSSLRVQSSLLASLSGSATSPPQTANPRRTTMPLKLQAPLSTTNPSGSHSRLSSLPLPPTLMTTKAAPVTPVVPMVPECDVCESNASGVQCDECDLALCSGCDSEIHAPKKMKTHVRQPVNGSGAGAGTSTSTSVNADSKATPEITSEPAVDPCSICEESAAEIDCIECSAAYCQGCDADFHAPQRTKSHQRTSRTKSVEHKPAATSEVESAPATAAAEPAAVPVTPSTAPALAPVPETVSGDSFSTYASIITRLTGLETALKSSNQERSAKDEAFQRQNQDIQVKLESIATNMAQIATSSGARLSESLQSQSATDNGGGSEAAQSALANAMLRSIMEQLARIQHSPASPRPQSQPIPHAASPTPASPDAVRQLQPLTASDSYDADADLEVQEINTHGHSIEPAVNAQTEEKTLVSRPATRQQLQSLSIPPTPSPAHARSTVVTPSPQSQPPLLVKSAAPESVKLPLATVAASVPRPHPLASPLFSMPMLACQFASQSRVIDFSALAGLSLGQSPLSERTQSIIAQCEANARAAAALRATRAKAAFDGQRPKTAAARMIGTRRELAVFE